MYIIRRTKTSDLPTLMKLARMVHFINLPPDKEILSQKVMASRRSLLQIANHEPAHIGRRQTRGPGGLTEVAASTDLYMFTLEDTDSPGCLGTSQLIAQMGGDHNPNFCFRLEKRESFSQSLQTGTTSVVAVLYEDTCGPTEVGGLILQPSFRGHPLRLGRLLSLIRFHFIGRFRKCFRDDILAEMMAPITPDGQSLLWEYLGRRFIPLNYEEADRFCQYSREFITSLMPHGDIQLSLLPPAARAVVGQVGTETIPARKMLERLGFEYDNLVDPFDGGPFLYAKTDEIDIIRQTKNTKLGQPIAKSKAKQRAIVSVLHSDGNFVAVEEDIAFDSRKQVRLPKAALEAMEARPGMVCGYTLMPPHHKRVPLPKITPMIVDAPAAKRKVAKKKTIKRAAPVKPARKAKRSKP